MHFLIFVFVFAYTKTRFYYDVKLNTNCMYRFSNLACLSLQREDNIGTAYNRSAKPFPSGGGGGGYQPAPGGGGGGYQPQPGPGYGARGPQSPQSPKQAVPNVVHAQFNSPIGLYSANNIADSYSQQTAGIQRQMSELVSLILRCFI